MIKRWLLTLVLIGFAGCAQAQNPQCPTRPYGDSTNACASTAFVQAAIATIPGTNVTFIQAGTGAITRTIQTKVRETDLSITDYGTDATAMTNVLNQAAASGQPVYIPLGTYTFGSAIAGDNIGVLGNIGTSFASNKPPGCVNNCFENNQSIFWKQASLNRTGTMVGSSWNAWLDTAQATMPVSNSTISIQRGVRLTMFSSDDPSNYGSSITRDAVGDQVIGTLNTIADGRMYGRHTSGYISSGSDGFLALHEMELHNQGATQRSMLATNAKLGLSIVAASGVTTTGLNFYDSALGGTFENLIFAYPNFVDGYFIRWSGIGGWMPDGSIRIGDDTAPSSASGLYIRNYNGKGVYVSRATGNPNVTLESASGVASSYISFVYSGIQNWSAGLDHATGQFRIAKADGFGSNNAIAIDPTSLDISTLGHISIAAGKQYKIDGTQISANNLSNGTTGTAGTAVVLATSPTLVTPNIGTATGTGLILTSSSANALAVGRQGSTAPALQIDASTASSATGLKVKAAAAAGGLALSVITSGTNENLTIDAAGSGTITIGGTSTGAITLTRATTMSAALTYGGVTLSNAVTGTGNMVLASSPTLTTPDIGAATGTSLKFTDGASPSVSSNGDAAFNGVAAYGAYFRGKGSVYDIGFINSANNAVMVVPTGTTDLYITGAAISNSITVGNGTYLITSNASFTNAAAAQVGTLTNAPIAGNPTKWIQINDNGTVRRIPAW